MQEGGMRRSSVLILLAAISLAPRAGAEEAKTEVEIQSLFAGKVEKFRARRIHLTYDVSDPKCLLDFVVANPFLVTRTGGFEVKDGALVGRGTAAILHKAVFDADLTIELTLRSESPNDIGVALIPPAKPETYLLFSLADTYFSLKDRQDPKQHMITVVGAEDTAPAGDVVFRYLKRATKPELKADKDLDVVVQKSGTRDRFAFGGVKLDAEDRYGKFEEVQPALFVLKSAMTITSLKISGRIAESWLKDHHVKWDPGEKDDEAAPDIPKPAADPEPGPGRRGWPPRRGWEPEGNQGASGLVTRLRDKDLDEAKRRKAAEGLTKENVKLDQLRALIDALMDEDLTARTLAIDVLKRVTGKTLGYHPNAPEKARRDAFRTWFRYMMQNRDRYRD
jgi:hypothetical protein